jgi:hypothetical protein
MIERKELEQGRPEALYDEQLQRKKQEKAIEGEAPPTTSRRTGSRRKKAGAPVKERPPS